eukprot:TRINITY_DN3875_c0_g1_i3.p1 TRINITY_DN3875_c0_g1~~TRINITY_DN3875_c0_g1_i3.p1  ORF type:complete len:2705 (+),score=687.62 TRINITY_DN3875_c0_g1_i3:85-8199(+)
MRGYKRIYQKLVNSKRTIVVLDLITDRVHSRFLSAVLFTILVIYVARMVLFSMFLSSIKMTSRPARIVIDGDGTQSLELGNTLDPISVAVLDERGGGMSISKVLCDIEAVGVQNDYRGLQGTSFDYLGVYPLSQSLISNGFLPKSLREPKVLGCSTFTDSNGKANFRFIRLENVVSGEYGLRFFVKYEKEIVDEVSGKSVTVEETLYSEENIAIAVHSTVRTVDVEDEDITVNLNEEFSMTVEISSNTFTPIPNRPVTAVLFHKTEDEKWMPQIVDDVWLPDHGILEGGYTVTNSNGKAVFKNLKITEAPTGVVRLGFVCEGTISTIVHAYVNHPKTVSKIEIVTTDIPKSMREDSFFETMEVKVLDSENKPIKGEVVLARITTAHGFPLQHGLSLWKAFEFNPESQSAWMYIGATKQVTNYFSMESDEEGIAKFSKLGFTKNGPCGEYSIDFLIGEVHSDPISIELTTSVNSIEMITNTPPDLIISHPQKFSVGTSADEKVELLVGHINSSKTWVPLSGKYAFMQVVDEEEYQAHKVNATEYFGTCSSVKECSKHGFYASTYPRIAGIFSDPDGYLDYSSAKSQVWNVKTSKKQQQIVRARFFIEGLASEWTETFEIVNLTPMKDYESCSALIHDDTDSYEILSRGGTLPKTQYTAIDAYNRPIGDPASDVPISKFQQVGKGHRYVGSMNGPLKVGTHDLYMEYALIANVFGKEVPSNSFLRSHYAYYVDSNAALFNDEGVLAMQNLDIEVAMDSYLTLLDSVHIQPTYDPIEGCVSQFNICAKSFGVDKSDRIAKCKLLCTETGCQTPCEQDNDDIQEIDGIKMKLATKGALYMCALQYNNCQEALIIHPESDKIIFRYECQGEPQHFALKTNLVVNTLCGPTRCNVATNCGPFEVEVKYTNGQPAVGENVVLRPVKDPNGEYFPSYLANDSPFLSNWPIAGRSSVWGIRSEDDWIGCGAGCKGTTDANGKVSFSPTILSSRPGKYNFYPEASGAVGKVFEETELINVVYNIEQIENSLHDYDCPDDLVSKACPNNCSSHGSCVCGMCICDSFWDSKHDCSIERSADDSPSSRPLPTVTLFQEKSTATSLLGSVKVTNEAGNPVPGVNIAAWAITCEESDTLEDRIDKDVFIGEIDSELSEDDRCFEFDYIVERSNVLLSSLTNMNGIASFSSDLSFISGASQCLQFIYTFYGTDTGGYGRQVNVFENAIVSEPGYKFRLINPISSMIITTPPSVLAAPGKELSQLPELEIVPSEGYSLDDFLMKCSAKIYDPSLGGFVDRCGSWNDTSSFMIEASAYNSQGENLPLVEVGSSSGCARIDAKTNRVIFEDLKFPSKTFTRSAVMIQNYDSLLSGDYYLSFSSRGVVFANNTQQITVTSITDKVTLIKGPDEMTVRVPAEFTLKATLSDGTPLAAVLVTVRMRSENGLLGIMEQVWDRTDDNGLVTLSNVVFSNGSSGDYILEFHSGSTILDHPVKLSNPVSSVIVSDQSWLTDTHILPLNRFKAVATRTLKMPLKFSITTSDHLVGDVPIVSTFYERPSDWTSRCSNNQTQCLSSMTPLENIELKLHGDSIVDWDSISCGIPCAHNVYIDSFTITGGSFSGDLLLFFSILGEPSNIIKVEFSTFADEYAWSIASLTDHMWFPLFIISPMFVANSLYIRFQWRFIALMTGFSTIVLMIVRASAFIDETNDMSKYFNGEGITYLQIMDKTLVILLIVAIIYLLKMILQHIKLEIKYLKMRRLGQIPNMKSGETGHYDYKCKEEDKYVRERLPSRIAPLLSGGSLSRMAKMALFEVFQRSANASSASILAKQLKHIQNVKQSGYDIIHKIFGGSETTQEIDMMFDGAGAMSKNALKDHVNMLLKVNLGSAVINSEYVSKQLVVETVLKRFKMYGPYTFMLDFKRLGVWGGKYSPMTNGLSSIKADAAHALKQRLDELSTNDSIPTSMVVELLCPYLASMIIECPPEGINAKTFLAKHEARMRSFVCADGLFCDRVCYAELGVLGYDHSLALKVLDNNKRFTNEAIKVMKEHIVNFSKEYAKESVVHLNYKETRKLFKCGKIQPLAKERFDQLIKFSGNKFDHTSLMLLFMQRYQEPEVAVRSFSNHIKSNDIRFRDLRHSTDCYFYPQRLLIAFMLSLTISCFMAMLMHYGAVSFKTWLNDSFDDAVEYQNNFIANMNLFIEDSVMHTISAVEYQLMDTSSSAATTGMIDHLKATAPPGIPDSVVDQLYQPHIIDGLIQAYITERFNSVGNGTSIVGSTSNLFGSELGTLSEAKDNFLGKISIEQFRSTLDGINKYGEPSVIAGSVMSYLVILLVWLQVLKTYRKRIFDARRGNYTLVWEKNNITKSVSYIGIQMSATSLGFLMFFLPNCMVLMILVLEPLRNFVWKQFYTMLPSLITLGLFVMIAQIIVMRKWLTNGFFVRYHRLYMLAELFFTFFNLFKGFFVSAIRLIMSILFFGVTFMRADVSQLPLESEQKDPVIAAYNGMLMLDMQSNHPMKTMFIRLLSNARKQRLRFKTVMFTKRSTLRDFKTDFVKKSINHLKKIRDFDDESKISNENVIGLSSSMVSGTNITHKKEMAVENPLLTANSSSSSVNSKSILFKSMQISIFDISCEMIAKSFQASLLRPTTSKLTEAEMRLLLLYFDKDLLFSYSLFQTREQRILKNRFYLLIMMSRFKELITLRNSECHDDNFESTFAQMEMELKKY